MTDTKDERRHENAPDARASYYEQKGFQARKKYDAELVIVRGKIATIMGCVNLTLRTGDEMRLQDALQRAKKAYSNAESYTELFGDEERSEITSLGRELDCAKQTLSGILEENRFE